MPPDYSRYSKADLEQALSTIDKARFPERVAQIHAALAAMEADTSSAHNATDPEAGILLPEPETPEQMQKRLLGTLATIFAGLIIGAMMLPAYFYSFLLDNQWVSLFRWIAWLIAGIVFVVTCRHMLKTRYLRKANAKLLAKGKRPMAVNSKRRVCGAILGAMIIGGLAGFATFRGAPLALHLYVLDSRTANEQVTIAKLPRRYRRKHCNGKIYLKEYSEQFFDYVCQVTPRPQWEKLRAGQQISLHGTRSKFGLLVSKSSL